MYIVYMSNGNKFQCSSMAEAINKLEKGNYQAANVFKVKNNGTIIEKVYEYRK